MEQDRTAPRAAAGVSAPRRRAGARVAPASLAALQLCLLVGCEELELFDRSAGEWDSSSATPPSFVADLLVPPARTVENVRVLGLGAPVTMPSLGAWRYSVNTPVPACAELIPYRYRVRHAGESGSAVEESFPPEGHFTRRMRALPATCGATRSSRAFQVVSTEDAVDAAPGDGICRSADRFISWVDPRDPGRRINDVILGRCTLRAAVMEANASRGMDLIQVMPGTYTLTRSGTEDDATPNAAIGDLDITESVVIESTAARSRTATRVVDFWDLETELPRETGLTAVARIHGSGRDRIFDVHGTESEVQLSYLHLTGGAVRNATDTSLRRYGGALVNRGLLLINRVAITNNLAEGVTGGAGIANFGRLYAQDLALLSNLGTTVGAAFGGTDGGAIYNAPGALLDLRAAVIAYNTAARGPGLHNDGNAAGDVLAKANLVNVSVTGNAGSGSAGAMRAALFTRGKLTVGFSTIYDDRAVLAHSSTASIEMHNSLWFGSDCPSGAGAVTASFGNWVEHANCVPPRGGPTLNDKVRTVLRGVTSGLSAATGFTPLLRLYRVSDLPEADQIPNSCEPALYRPPFDQRGQRRPANWNDCDPGAYELAASE